MDTNPPQPPPAPDHGPDDHALVRLLRALAAPLRARPAQDVRRRHIAAASAAARSSHGAPAPASARRFGLFARVRPALAGGLALSLVAALVVGVSVTGPDRVEVELAMEPGFTPSPVPFERAEDHVILTVDAARAELVTEELTRLLGADPAVLSVRTDRTAFTVPASVADQLEVPEVEAIPDTPMTNFAEPTTQSPVPSWGLDRIDADEERLDDSYGFVSTGSGVRVYVIDTGVRSDHADLAGRVVPGYSAIDDGRGSEDCNGHGTHVAGTVAGSSYGVAKDATIVAVRVLDCNGAGYASSVVSGISWAIANHPGGPGVINLSLGGPANSAVDQAVADATARGLLVVAAAGNNGGDACALSPARAPSAVTIGATTSSDVRASYSNFGGCVDLFAPGSSITSAWWSSPGASATLSGTSMAAPHVAGIAARLLEDEPGSGPAGVTGTLTGEAESGVVGDDGGSPNLLLNLVDYEQVDCDVAYEEHLADGTEIPEDCLEEVCERLELEGIDLPEECLDGDGEDPDCDQLEEDGEELPEECLEEDDERGREGEGRPDSPPGLDGLLPPGFGGPVPGLERAPGLDGRLPPGLSDGVPPGLADREDGVPPGQADREDRVPPGQADREDRVPPGQADREDRVPPGQADREDRVPPGQADREDGDEPPADGTDPDEEEPEDGGEPEEPAAQTPGRGVPPTPAQPGNAGNAGNARNDGDDLSDTNGRAGGTSGNGRGNRPQERGVAAPSTGSGADARSVEPTPASAGTSADERGRGRGRG